MSVLVLLAALTVSPLAPAATHAHASARDTALVLQRGDRIVLGDLSGTVRVEAVEGDRLEVTTAGRTDDVTLRRENGRIMIRAAGRGGSGRTVDVRLRVPAWAEVEIEGRDLDASIRGMSGPVTVVSISGDLHIEATSGPVRARTLQGEITADAATGPLVLSSDSDDVHVRGASGSVDVRSLAGDLYLERLRAPSVRAETQAGDVTFSGDIVAGGSYRFSLHSGDALLELPGALSATIRVSTFDGTFESEFPVMVAGFTTGRPFEFTVGGGEADIRVDVFDGEIRLVKRNR